MHCFCVRLQDETLLFRGIHKHGEGELVRRLRKVGEKQNYGVKYGVNNG